MNKKKLLLTGIVLAVALAWAGLGRAKSTRATPHLEATDRDDELSTPAPPPADPPDTPSGIHAAGLQYLVDHDQLTGLKNRHGFERVLGESLSAPDRNGHGALIKFGMDNFRHLNASRGRETCDLVLTSVASLLARAAPDAPAVARIGGDTFAVFLPEADRSEAEAVSRAVIQAVHRADLDVEREGIRATMSAGITLLDRRELTPGDALLEADLAMARAKNAGRDRVAVYTRAEARPFKATQKWAEDIREALETGSLQLYAQPVQSLKSEHVQWELLVRLPDQVGQLMPPASLLPTAERFGLVERVDTWVVEQAFELIDGHRLAGRRLDLEVNVSARSLADARFAELVGERLAASGVDPTSLIFEVSEAVAVESLDEVRLFAEQLKELGCRFALDDFGTKHASLSHLRDLPIDFVKIDGAFIRHLADDEGDRRIVRAVIELAHTLGQSVIAASVGDDETMELLRQWGADYVQGFSVGQPRPAAELL